MLRRVRRHALVLILAMTFGARAVAQTDAEPTDATEPGTPPPPSSVGPAPGDEDADLDGFESDPRSESEAFEPFILESSESPRRRRLETYPVRVPDRPLNLPSWWLAATVGLGFAPGRVCAMTAVATLECDTLPTTHMLFAASYGFSRWFTVESRVAVRVHPDFEGDSFSMRVRTRIFDRRGHRLAFDVAYGEAVASGDGTERFNAGPYAALRLSPRARFRVGADVGFARVGSDLDWTFGVPLAVDLAPRPRLILRIETRASFLGPRADSQLAWELPAAFELGGVVVEFEGRPACEFYARAELDPVGPDVSLDRQVNRWSLSTGVRFLRAQLPPDWRSR